MNDSCFANTTPDNTKHILMNKRCLSFFLWPLYFLSFDLRLLITPLVSSKNSQEWSLVILNICYCSIRNNWVGHKFHNLDTSSPIHTWINTKWTYIILYAYFILSDDMKKKQKQKQTKTKNVERHAGGLSKLMYT